MPHVRKLRPTVTLAWSATLILGFWVMLGPSSAFPKAAESRILMTATQKKTNQRVQLNPGALSARTNRGATAAISKVETATNTPIHFLLLVEASDFTRKSTKLKRALQESKLVLQDALKIYGGDITIYAFNKAPLMLVEQTKDFALLDQKLASLPWGKKTALLDALSIAVESMPDDQFRRIAIIFSDGEDDSSHISQKSAIKAARQKAVTVYALDTFLGFRRHNGSRLMENLADATGGRLLWPEDANHIALELEKLQNDLSAQYWITVAASGQQWKFKYNEPGVELLYPH